MGRVEKPEAVEGGLAEFGQRDAAAQVLVSRGNRLGDIEQGEAAAALRPIKVRGLERNIAAIVAGVRSGRGGVGIAVGLGRIHRSRFAMDFGRDHGLVIRDLVGVDFAIVIGVEPPEKGAGHRTASRRP